MSMILLLLFNDCLLLVLCHCQILFENLLNFRMTTFALCFVLLESDGQYLMREKSDVWDKFPLFGHTHSSNEEGQKNNKW